MRQGTSADEDAAPGAPDAPGEDAAVPGAGLELVHFFWPGFVTTGSSACDVDAKLDLLADDGSPTLLKLMIELGFEDVALAL